MQPNIPMMSWGDRFALIDEFNPSYAAICAAFGLSRLELNTALKLRSVGTFAPNPRLDVHRIGNIFPDIEDVEEEEYIESNAPQTFTKKWATIKPPKKRGRKGNKITNALLAVTKTPIPVDTFIQQYDVSLSVLKQAKRFVDNMPTEIAAKIGKIVVKKDKDTKQVMIWREDLISPVDSTTDL